MQIIQMPKQNTSMQTYKSMIFLMAILFLTICMLLFPEAAYQGACNGIRTWAVHLLPSLLPFFIVSNLLFSLGFVRFLGVLLEPIMRPLFRLPGEAGFALALGFTSGFPMGAILTASLCEQNLCTKEEAARLAAFTNNSSPLFLLTAIPVSMLHAPKLGILLLSAHYAANLTIGIFLRFTAPKTKYTVSRRNHHVLRNAVYQLIQYQHEHICWPGTLLSQAVQKGISSIVNIGGFVLFFSVLLSMLEASRMLIWIENFFAFCLRFLDFSPQLSKALAAGLFEMTLGTQTAALYSADLLDCLMVISFILGWSGLSIQAQVCSILSEQQISTKLYCLCRPLQGMLAACYIPLFIHFFPWMLDIPANDSLFGDTVLTSSFHWLFYAPWIILSVCVLLLVLFFSISRIRRMI